ncbi:hypothetical protein L665_00761 [Ralstonia solanacearum SD54]|nr:hypothetical protein F504_1517 [Ralstonia pseudosolanacearum FQY_4]ANH33174.1 hypothetical protein A3768_2025 [Ralstonia solanacearum]ESS50683.1 hypothetical protein L665_00761 [Ralstonia solanacearum SD54]
MPTMRSSSRLATVDPAGWRRGADWAEGVWSVLGVFMSGW